MVRLNFDMTAELGGVGGCVEVNVSTNEQTSSSRDRRLRKETLPPSKRLETHCLAHNFQDINLAPLASVRRDSIEILSTVLSH